MTQRSVAKVVPATRTVEGGGFVVRRTFPSARLDMVDPFLLLDHMGPSDYAPGEAVGAPDHPHRGFETVTYMLEGAFEHRDSSGGGGYLGPGDVQWMTAGAGIVHSEEPAERIRRDGGRVHGLQLWVNLPRADKMSPPRYQEIKADEIPVTEPAPGARVKVVAGDVLGVRGPVAVHSPIVYLHAKLQAGAAIDVPVPNGHQAFAYVISGRGQFGADETEASESQLVLFAGEEGDVHLAGADDLEGPLDALVISGVPLREPVARYGPFVMNTRAELVQAVDDYQSGAMGRIAATS
ncbi:MAG TPA: pirin family protein [Acidimicrobiia bacterium]|nr:pirin family protein [Acidimicrobiia bacterium]